MKTFIDEEKQEVWAELCSCHNHLFSGFGEVMKNAEEEASQAFEPQEVQGGADEALG